MRLPCESTQLVSDGYLINSRQDGDEDSEKLLSRPQMPGRWLGGRW